MGKILNIAAGLVLAGAVLAHHAHAAPPQPVAPPNQVAPPKEWAEYFAAVRKAEQVQGEEARCRAYPDIPGNQWRPGAAQARCALLRAPAFPLDRIETLLATPGGVDELERGFAALLDAHYADATQREQIFISLVDVFDASPRAGELALRWFSLRPDSAFANTAAGLHYAAAGWKARGGAYARNTSDEKFERMTAYFAQAVPLFLKSMELEPRLSVACYRLDTIGRASSDALQTVATAHCLKVDPDSYYVNWGQVVSAQPRWSGSDAQLREAVAFAAARTDRNPMLGAFLGEAVGYWPSMADEPREVVDDLVAAARMGPGGYLMAQAGKGYRHRQEPWPAIAYYSQASRFWPNDPLHRYWRAVLLVDYVKDFEWARDDMRAALASDPDDADYNYLMGVATEATEGAVAARTHYRRAMSGNTRFPAMRRLCWGYIHPQVDKQADACTRELVEAFPGEAAGWHLRVQALQGLQDEKGAQAASREIESLARRQQAAEASSK